MSESGKYITGCVPWNKGLTKETDSRVAKQAVAISVANTGNPNVIAANKEINNRTDVKIKKIAALTGHPNLIAVKFIPDRSHLCNVSPYPLSFGDISEYIWERDNGICQYPGCGKILQRGNGKFARHHLDFDETNSDSNNLILLCRKHHSYVHKHNIILD